jgi:hypothetical protein
MKGNFVIQDSEELSHVCLGELYIISKCRITQKKPVVSLSPNDFQKNQAIPFILWGPQG